MFKIFIVCALASFAVFAQEMPFDEKLTGWRIKGECAAEEFSGRHVARVGKDSFVYRGLKLEPHARYKLTYCIKGKNISSKGNDGARVVLNTGNQYQRITARAGNHPDTGTFDWRVGTGIIKADDFKSSNVTLLLECIGDGTAWYDGVKLEKLPDEEQKPVATAARRSWRGNYGQSGCSARLFPEGINGVFLPGESVSLKLVSEGCVNPEFSLVVKDENGKTVHTIERKAVGDGAISVPGMESGYYVADAEIFSAGRKACYVQAGFVVTPAFEKRDNFFQFGFGVSMSMLDGFKRVGAGSMCMKLAAYRRDDAETSARKELSKYSELLARDDFELSCCVSAAVLKDCSRTPEELAAGWPVMSDEYLRRIEKFVELFASATKDNLKHWFVQQEIPSSASIPERWCGSWTEAMFHQLAIGRIVSRKVRKIVPGAIITIGGNNQHGTTNRIEDIVMSDLCQDFDFYAIDAYPGNWDMTGGYHVKPEGSLMKFYRESSELSKKLGKGELIRNEEIGYAITYGAPYDNGMSREQAELTARCFIISRAAPVINVELHKPVGLWESSKNDNDRDMNTLWRSIDVKIDGKTRTRTVPLPGCSMYATLAHELSFAKVHSEIVAGNICCYIFTRPDGKCVVAMWNAAGEETRLPVELPVSGERVSLYGRRSGITAGKQELVLNNAPFYMEFPADAADGLSARLKEIIVSRAPEMACSAVRLKDGTVAVYVRSLLKSVMEATISIPGLDDRKVTLLPGQMSMFNVGRCSAKAGNVKSPGQKYDFKIHERSFVPVQRLKEKPVFNGTGSWLNKLSSGILKYPENIQPETALHEEKGYFKSSSNPNGHNIWSRYWLASDDECFYFAVEVDDPVHQQRYEGIDIWRDDCLQFAFAHGKYMPSDIIRKGDKVEPFAINCGIGLTGEKVMSVCFSRLDKDGTKVFRANACRRNGRTFYEVAVPWKNMGLDPKKQDIAFDFVVFDNNKPGRSTSPYWLELSPGLAGENDQWKMNLLDFK